MARKVAVDRWKFFAITHRDHSVCNPLSVAKLDELVTLLALPPQARVVDIACGKAELLVRLAEHYDVRGDGVDLSPDFVSDARQRAAARVSNAALRFHEQDGRTFAATPHGYDLAMCVGASWTFGGHRDTLQALAHWVRPGGQVAVGEPYWRQQPDPGYLAASGGRPDAFATHAQNVAIGVDLGLVPLYTLASSQDDWDRYEGLQWQAAERYAITHPDDPDVPELLARIRAQRDLYLQWGRDTVGWAVYLFRVA